MVRGVVLSRAAILVAAAALVASGCSSGGKTSGGSRKAAGVSGKSFHDQVAPGFAAATRWTVDLPWAADGSGRQRIAPRRGLGRDRREAGRRGALRGVPGS